MIRALVVCAVVSFASLAIAQVKDGQSVEPQPTIAAPTGANVSACNEHGCTKATGEPSTVATPATPQKLLRQKLAEMNCLQAEIEELRRTTGTPQQILIKVQVLEVSRTKLGRLKTEFAAQNSKGKVETQAFETLLGDSQINSTMHTIEDGAAARGMIDWLCKNNVAKMLSEPNLVVTCGRPASLHIGGEVPIPMQPGSQQTVDYKPFGTQVDCLAVAQGNNRVRLEFRARVSELDEAHATAVKGERVPAVTVKQIDTGIELALGSTGVLSGLTEKRVEAVKAGNKIHEEVNNIDLVFLITPESTERIAVMPVDSSKSFDAVRTADATGEPIPGEHSLLPRTHAIPR